MDQRCATRLRGLPTSSATGCGDPSPRIQFVGQVGVIKKVKGVLVHPAQVKATLSQFPELGNFQIVVDHLPDSIDDFRSVATEWLRLHASQLQLAGKAAARMRHVG